VGSHFVDCSGTNNNSGFMRRVFSNRRQRNTFSIAASLSSSCRSSRFCSYSSRSSRSFCDDCAALSAVPGRPDSELVDAGASDLTDCLSTSPSGVDLPQSSTGSSPIAGPPAAGCSCRRSAWHHRVTADLHTYGEVTSQNLWPRYDRHFVGTTWHNVWS